MTKRKIKEIWMLIRAKHYAVLIANSENEIAWAIDSLKKADDIAKQGFSIPLSPDKKEGSHDG